MSNLSARCVCSAKDCGIHCATYRSTSQSSLVLLLNLSAFSEVLSPERHLMLPQEKIKSSRNLSGSPLRKALTPIPSYSDSFHGVDSSSNLLIIFLPGSYSGCRQGNGKKLGSRYGTQLQLSFPLHFLCDTLSTSTVMSSQR